MDRSILILPVPFEFSFDLGSVWGGGAYLDVEVDGNTAFVQGHVRGL